MRGVKLAMVAALGMWAPTQAAALSADRNIERADELGRRGEYGQAMDLLSEVWLNGSAAERDAAVGRMNSMLKNLSGPVDGDVSAAKEFMAQEDSKEPFFSRKSEISQDRHESLYRDTGRLKSASAHRRAKALSRAAKQSRAVTGQPAELKAEEFPDFRDAPASSPASKTPARLPKAKPPETADGVALPTAPQALDDPLLAPR